MSKTRRLVKLLVETPQDEVSLTASGGATPSNTSPAIYCVGCWDLLLTVIHNYTESNSTDLDINIYTSYDGATFDTVPYASLSVTSKCIKTIPVTPGMHSVKVEVKNNDAVNSTKVTTKLTKTF